MMLHRCYMCKKGDETMNHIPLHRSKGVILLPLIFAMFGVE